MIIWRTVLFDIMNDELLEVPQVVALYKIDTQKAGEVQRLRWNVLGTCLATSGEHGDVRIWQRTEGDFNVSAISPFQTSGYAANAKREESLLQYAKVEQELMRPRLFEFQRANCFK